MTCYVLAMGKQHLLTQVVVGYGIKIFCPAFSLRHQITWKIRKKSRLFCRLVIHQATHKWNIYLLIIFILIWGYSKQGVRKGNPWIGPQGSPGTQFVVEEVRGRASVFTHSNVDQLRKPIVRPTFHSIFSGLVERTPTQFMNNHKIPVQLYFTRS